MSHLAAGDSSITANICCERSVFEIPTPVSYRKSYYWIPDDIPLARLISFNFITIDSIDVTEINTQDHCELDYGTREWLMTWEWLKINLITRHRRIESSQPQPADPDKSVDRDWKTFCRLDCTEGEEESRVSCSDNVVIWFAWRNRYNSEMVFFGLARANKREEKVSIVERKIWFYSLLNYRRPRRVLLATFNFHENKSKRKGAFEQFNSISVVMINCRR